MVEDALVVEVAVGLAAAAVEQVLVGVDQEREVEGLGRARDELVQVGAAQLDVWVAEHVEGGAAGGEVFVVDVDAEHARGAGARGVEHEPALARGEVEEAVHARGVEPAELLDAAPQLAARARLAAADRPVVVAGVGVREVAGLRFGEGHAGMIAKAMGLPGMRSVRSGVARGGPGSIGVR